MINPPEVTNISRNLAVGSCDIAVEDESYITIVRVCDVFGREREIGRLTGSGTLPLDFSYYTGTLMIGDVPITLASPCPELKTVTTDGAGNYSAPGSSFLCQGIVLWADRPVITDYFRDGARVTFIATGVITDRTFALWNKGGGALTAQVMVEGENEILNLTPTVPYSFLSVYNKVDGEVGIAPSEFGDSSFIFTVLSGGDMSRVFFNKNESKNIALQVIRSTGEFPDTIAGWFSLQRSSDGYYWDGATWVEAFTQLDVALGTYQPLTGIYSYSWTPTDYGQYAFTLCLSSPVFNSFLDIQVNQITVYDSETA